MRRGRLFGLVLLVFLLSLFSFQTASACSKSSASHAVSASLVQDTPSVPPPANTRPEPPVNPPVTQAKSETERYTLSHERYEKAIAYSRAGYTLYFVSYFLNIAVLFFILFSGTAARLRDLAIRRSDNRFVQGLFFIPLLMLVADVLELPVSIYWHSLSLKYAQSIQPWGSWLLDWFKEEVIYIALYVVLFEILFLVIGKSPRRWWLHFWFAALPILLIFFYISPWFISPLFNRFEPLSKDHPKLVTAIEKVAHRAGLSIPPDRIYVMYASEKTPQINANVAGFGASKRVVLWDTTIEKTTQDETLFIFGHEAGHYVLGHVRLGVIFFAVLLFVALYCCYVGVNRMTARWGSRWKMYGPQDWVSLAVFLLLLEVVMFLSSPVVNGFSRWQEHEADIYGIEVIHGIVPNSSEVAAHAFQVMGEADLADPNPPPFITFWLFSHPPLADRIVFAHTYDPWARGEPPKYVK